MFHDSKEQGKGTSLGLATAYGIVKQAEATFRCTANWLKGQHSKFSFLQPARGRVMFSWRARAVYGGETVMVEDELAPRASANFSPPMAARQSRLRTGKRPLNYSSLSWGVSTVLLTNVVMPKMSGREPAEAFRQVAGHKIIYMSGYADNAIVRHGVLSRQVPHSCRLSLRELADKLHDGA